MSLLYPFSPGQNDAEKPIDQQLNQLNFQGNLEDLATQIDNISVGGGGAQDSGAIGEIVLGGETNEAIYWKRRFHPLEHMLNADSKNPSGFDPEGKSLKNELLTFIQSNDAGLSVAASTNTYLGMTLLVNKDSSYSFKIKKGVNFFSLGFVQDASTSDAVTILIDGNSVSSLGLTDENGIARSDDFSTSRNPLSYQVTEFFYGLDGEEHTIQLINNDSASATFNSDFIEVGFRSNNPTINEQVNIKKGKAAVRGTEATFQETELQFSKTEVNGHTSSIVCDTQGNLTALDGESPAMTQVKPEETINFSSTVTTLPVKNNFYFPENGIFLLSTPYGNHHLGSYTSKTDTLIQSHSFDDIVWQSQPTEDFKPLDGFTGGLGEATGDLNINYWGTAPILINSSNNKIDFKITIDGVTTTHAATVVNGRYSADLVPIEKAIRLALRDIKPINGQYYCKYSSSSHLWSIYIDSPEVENFELLFSTGVNSASSISETLGFSDTDLTGSLSYIAVDEKEHRCCRALEADSVYMHSEDPRIKYSFSNDISDFSSVKDITERLGFPSFRGWATGGTTPLMIQIFPDQDCCGIEISAGFLTTNSMLSYQIDDGQVLYLTQTDTTIANTSVRGKIISSFISFPRGSRKITIRNETSGQFEIEDNIGGILFYGARQYFTKPSYEKLTKSQAIIKTFDISPVSLYATIYGHNGGTLYSPAASDDNINTIIESGFGGSTVTAEFNGARRDTTTINAYVEIDFTLVGDGGGISLKNRISSSGTHKMGMYLSSTAINESTDRINNTHADWAATYYDTDNIGQLGLLAGTYKARFKNEHSDDMTNHGIVIYDTIPPQENANSVTDLNNTGQGVAYPVNVIREAAQKDSANKVPNFLLRSGYKEGRPTNINYSTNVGTFNNYDDSSTIIINSDRYYGSEADLTVSGEAFSISGFFKSVSLKSMSLTGNTGTFQAFVDGVQELSSFGQLNQVKGGSAPSSTRRSITVLNGKLYGLSCVHNSGLVFDLSDTRGFKNDAEIILNDGANKERAIIASFVVGVSFTIKKALTTVVAANVTAIDFSGFHNFEVVSQNANKLQISNFEYEPLKVSPSKALQRRSQDFEYVKISRTFRSVATGADLYYPTDPNSGLSGNWSNSDIKVIGSSAGSSFSFPQDLKNIVVGSGTIDVIISSEFWTPKVLESDRF